MFPLVEGLVLIMSRSMTKKERDDRMTSIWEARLLFGVGVGRWTDWAGV